MKSTAIVRGFIKVRYRYRLWRQFLIRIKHFELDQAMRVYFGATVLGIVS
jgi:hypothetical protein